MADFKKLHEEKMRLERRVGKAKKEIVEAGARLAVVNKEIEEDTLAFAEQAKERQAWFDQK